MAADRFSVEGREVVVVGAARSGLAAAATENTLIARPSSPSVRLTALVAPTSTSAANGM